MITAQKARELAKANDAETVTKKIIELIEAAAKLGKFEIKVRDFGFGTTAYYGGPNEWPSLGKQVVGVLRGLGYVADFKSEDRQFVDIWLNVSWKDEP